MEPPDGAVDRPDGTVEYEPVSVNAVLSEMKDTAELRIDLSFSAVLHGSDDLAREVLALESRMAVLGAPGADEPAPGRPEPEDAEQLAPVLGVVGAAEKIGDAAGDVAEVVLDNVGLPDAMRAALPEAVEESDEVIVRLSVVPGSEFNGVTLGDRAVGTETGMEVIVVAGPTTRSSGSSSPVRGRNSGPATCSSPRAPGRARPDSGR